MKQFIASIVYDLKFSFYWDDYLFAFYQFLELESLDSDIQLPSQIYISHFIALFTFDILFSFLSNFSNYENKEFISNFKYLNEFVDFSLNLLSKTLHNFNSYFDFSDKKRKIIEHECDKTEYKITDSFNYYGVCLAYLILLNKRQNNVLPLVIEKNYYFNVSLSIYNIILKTEIEAKIIILKDFKQIGEDLVNYNILPEIEYIKLKNKTITSNLVNLVGETIKQGNWDLTSNILNKNINKEVSFNFNF